MTASDSADTEDDHGETCHRTSKDSRGGIGVTMPFKDRRQNHETHRQSGQSDVQQTEEAYNQTISNQRELNGRKRRHARSLQMKTFSLRWQGFDIDGD